MFRFYFFISFVLSAMPGAQAEDSCTDSYIKTVTCKSHFQNVKTAQELVEALTKTVADEKNNSTGLGRTFSEDKLETANRTLTDATTNKDLCVEEANEACSQTKNEKEVKALQKAGSHCSNSEMLGHGDCDITDTVRDVSQGVTMGTETLGGTMIQNAGSKDVMESQQRMQNGGNVMRDSYISTANGQERAADWNLASAVTSFTGAAAMAWRATEHFLNKGRLTEDEAKEFKTKGLKSEFYEPAKKEQNARAVKSIIEGAGMLSQGTTKMLAAQSLRETANANRELANQIYDPFTDVIPVTVTADPVPTQQPFALSPGDDTNNTNQASVEDPYDPGVNLGPPFDPNTDTADLEPLPHSEFQSTGPPPGSGGGSAAAGLGGGASLPKEEEGSAKMAPNDGPKVRYNEGQGGGYATGGRTPQGQASPDLSGLLAQFLPKEEDKNKAKNGILEYGRREPSSGDTSLLGPQENIFERVSNRYLEQLKRKTIGI